MKTTNILYYLILVSILKVTFVSAQLQPSKLKGLLQFGVNMPEEVGFVSNYKGKEVNFPTIVVGVESMFTKSMGVRLDLGHNRVSSQNNTPEFKLNYTRVNAQFTYDFSTIVPLLPVAFGIVGHLGPGYTFVKPLAELRENKANFFNAMGGLEIHFGLSKTASVFVDGSYIYGFGKKFDPVASGFGSYNGNLTTITIGLAVSLSGCYYCTN